MENLHIDSDIARTIDFNFDFAFISFLMGSIIIVADIINLNSYYSTQNSSNRHLCTQDLSCHIH